MDTALYIAAIAIVALAGLLGIALTMATLSGAWLTVLAAVIVELWRPGSFSWWTIGAASALALAGEVYELISGGTGATKSGGTKRSAAFAIIGGLIGALAGTVLLPVPIVGTIVGAVVGSGVGAIGADRTKDGRTWRESLEVGRGAAVGRAAAVVVKTVLAAAIALLLTVAAAVP